MGRNEKERLQSTERFREINEAYQYLRSKNSCSENEDSQTNEATTGINYVGTLMKCLQLFQVQLSLVKLVQE